MSKQTDLINIPDAITVSGSNVGIGTSSGANLLNMHQSSASSNSYLHITHVDGGSAATDGLSIGLESDGVNAVIRNRENGYLRMYTNNTERMRIDSSGNLLIGKTSTGLSVTGTQITSDGRLMVTRDGNQAADFNRKSSDGDIVKFQKDGTTVGSIQSRAGAMTSLVLNPSGSDGAGFTGGSNAILPVSASALVDNTIDLGVGSYRYNDLFLGGGIHLGGTGSANKLEDYEEGTFTPVFSHGGSTTDLAASYNYQLGKYTRVGNLVTYIIDIDGNGINTSAPSGGFSSISGLPFVSSGAHSFPIATQRNTTALSCASTQVPRFWVNSTSSYVFIQFDTLHTGASDSGGSWDSSGRINITGHYYTQ